MLVYANLSKLPEGKIKMAFEKIFWIYIFKYYLLQIQMPNGTHAKESKFWG